MSIVEQLRALKEQDPEDFAALQELAVCAGNPSVDPALRFTAAMTLAEVLGPLMAESLRNELTRPFKSPVSSPQPQYRYVRGARVRIGT